MRREPTRAVIRRFVPGVVLVVAGLLVLSAAGDHRAVTVAGLLLDGLGGIWIVSAAFFTIGRSEDLDRGTR